VDAVSGEMETDAQRLDDHQDAPQRLPDQTGRRGGTGDSELKGNHQQWATMET